ncbi:MAG: hypothetical protein HRU03_00065 [Nanoarchaeales archaeon]|nr:hypothetical protein [Nanoarchaeales archaeon]
MKDLFVFGVVIYLFTSLEVFLFKALPLSILILLSALHILIYAIYDAKKKEFDLSWKVYSAGALTLAALVLINF